MRRSIVATVFKKELLDQLRDKRTLLVMLGIPILLYPLLIVGMGKMTESQQDASEARVSQVAIWGKIPESLLTQLRANDKLALTDTIAIPDEVQGPLAAGELPLPPDEETQGSVNRVHRRLEEHPELPEPLLAAGRVFLLARSVDAILVAWPDVSAADQGNGLGHVSVLYDSVRPDSQKARDRVQDELTSYRRELLAGRETRLHVPQGFTKGLVLHLADVAPKSRRLGDALGGLLGFILVFMTVLGGFYSAIDLTAGEKERNTMQTLMCAPVTSLEVIAGKFGAVWLIALLASLANLLSFAATFARTTLVGVSLAIAPNTYAFAFLLLLPVSLMMSAICLAIATFGRSYKEAQSYLTPVMLVLALPSALASVPGFELSVWTAFVPIVNISLMIKSVFLGEAHVELVFFTLVSSLAYAALALLLAARVYAREAILVGGRESLREVFGLSRRAGGQASPQLSFVSFACVLVLAFYGSLALGAATPQVAIGAELCFFLLPAVALTLGLRLPVRETLALRLPSWRGLVAALLIGCSAWAVTAGGVVRLAPPPESMARAFEKILLPDGTPAPLWLLLVALAVTPALAEEFFFRGLVQSGLKGLGAKAAIFLTALMFGVAHASIYRLLPTLFLGLLLGFVLWRTGSLLATMVVHLLNNAFAVVIATQPELAAGLGIDEADFLPWQMAVAGGLVTLLGLLLLARVRTDKQSYARLTPAADTRG